MFFKDNSLYVKKFYFFIKEIIIMLLNKF